MFALRKLALATLLLVTHPALAAGTPPTDASVKELLTLTDSRRLLDMTVDQVNANIETALLQANDGKPFDKQERKIVDKMKASITRVFKEEMSWTQMEPLFLSIYQASLSQDEVDGMIAFYGSDAGRAVVKKMPLLVQNSMQAVQNKMGEMGPRIEAIQQETVQAFEKLEKSRKK